MDDSNKDWKLKLRYGKITTPYLHYTLIAKGIIADKLEDGFECPKGNAFMGMKIWAISADDAADIIQSIAAQIGFAITGNIEVYETAPEQPPGEIPFGYDIQFTPFVE